MKLISLKFLKRLRRSLLYYQIRSRIYSNKFMGNVTILLKISWFLVIVFNNSMKLRGL